MEGKSFESIFVFFSSVKGLGATTLKQCVQLLPKSGLLSNYSSHTKTENFEKIIDFMTIASGNSYESVRK